MSDADSERSSATYTALNQRFLVRDRNFKRQYSHISSSLLKQITPLAGDEALRQFVPPPVVPARRAKLGVEPPAESGAG